MARHHDELRDDELRDDRRDENRSQEDRSDLPGPADDADTSLGGSTDSRSSENRRKGLQREENEAEDRPDRERE